MRSLLLGAVLLVLLWVPKAGATIQLTIQGGGPPIVVTDRITGGPGTALEDQNDTEGVIVFTGTVGNWKFNVTVGIVGTDPLIDLNSVNGVSGNGTGPNALTIQFSGNHFPAGTPAFTAGIGGTLATTHILTYAAWFDPGDALDAKTNQIGSTLSFGPGGAFSGSTNGGPAPGAPYSLTQVVKIEGTGGATFPGSISSFDANIEATPEPGSVVLLSGILLGTFGALRRRFSA